MGFHFKMFMATAHYISLQLSYTEQNFPWEGGYQWKVEKQEIQHISKTLKDVYYLIYLKKN